MVAPDADQDCVLFPAASLFQLPDDARDKTGDMCVCYAVLLGIYTHCTEIVLHGMQ